MTSIRPLALLLALLPLSAFAQGDWQRLSQPRVADLTAQFQTPPPEYGQTLTWGWEGPIDADIIRRDLDAIYQKGLRAVTIEAGYRMKEPYLSPGWFELVKTAVAEAKKRNMRVWIIDEGKYPSGFAGGKFSAERPDLRMQGLVVAERIKAKAGDVITRRLPGGTVGVVTVNTADKSNTLLPTKSGELTWTAPAGDWEVLVVQHRFKTSVTRAANNSTGGKDTLNSLCDYLNPLATRQFIDFTHEQYKKYIGAEFGKTVLGFRGDEPDYGFTPWTPAILDEFKKRKGYDVQPYLAAFFTPQLTEDQRRAKADYWDVWSDLFGENFFKVQGDWCAANGLDYMVHLNHEDQMMSLVRSSGDFFKNMRSVQVPGVDAIWDQIWMDKVADFPKLASSAAHLFGRPRSLSESFAAYRPAPTVAQAKWVVDQQLVRGITFFEYMYYPSSASGRPRSANYLASDEFPALANYSNRASYLLAQGTPAARIALYMPTTSLWLGAEMANKSVWTIAQQLLEQQHDFDFVDEYSLTTGLIADSQGLKNGSGQHYQTVIIPSVLILSKTAVDRLQRFAKAGGHVLFLGQLPTAVTDKSFLKAGNAPAFTWAIQEPSGQLTAPVKAALPPPDVALDQPSLPVKYLHRTLQAGELYFFFNESDQPQQRQVTLQGEGQVQLWHAATGQIENSTGTSPRKGYTQTALTLGPHETRFILIDASAPKALKASRTGK